MRAVVVDPRATGRFVISNVEPPVAARSENLVRVAAFSLNLGELRRSATAPAGWRPGWDLAGVVEQQAADGSGPAKGSRVVGLLNPPGAWAELVAVPTDALAQLPATVSFAQAAVLPVAGLTALYALDMGCPLLGTNVLITGASGGVGHLACQLAHEAGAHVVASVRRPEREPIVRAAGADDVVTGEDLAPAAAYGPYSLVLESVGGASLGTALTLLAPGGICVLFGASGGTEVTFDARRFYSAGALRLYGFILFDELTRKPACRGLERLSLLLAEGKLRPHIDLEARWDQVASVAERMLNREFAGKVVLHVES